MSEIPVWNNTGIEPSEEIKQNGFVKGYRPPAEHFNWFFNRTSAALTDLSSPETLEVGLECDASGQYAVATGYHTTAFGDASHAEGYYSTAGDTTGTHGDVTSETNIKASHAEGSRTTSKGFASHSEGNMTLASGTASHAEGNATKATGDHAHAEGSGTTASGDSSHAEGATTTASGAGSHAGGKESVAQGDYSYAHGNLLTANAYNYVVGKFNKIPTAADPAANTGDLFIVGNGLTGGARGNALRVTAAGAVMGTQAYTASGADYAELFEWLDGNSDGSDRRGLFVTLDGEKIRLANPDDTYILGVVSATPSIIGDACTDDWHGKYVTDVFGAKVLENGAYKLSDGFDSEKDGNYISRLERPEWAAVGLVGKLIVCDDGTCQVNSYCYPSESGVATASETGYRVIARIDENHIKVIMK